MCITTNDTFSGEEIQQYVKRFDELQQVLLIVDEAHNFGSPYMINVMPWNINYRMALSATISRHMDKTGTQKIYDYFGKKCIEYSLENLSNGETIAINFVFIVSILELAKKYRELEKENEEFGMENAILGLPLVLDGPFSALSNENTTLVAGRLPEFAEQVIIFMLDKDWEASGLEKYTLPEYCYRVNKEASSNSSTLEHE